jgi:hypothetical protein
VQVDHQTPQNVLLLAEREEADEVLNFDSDPLSFKFNAPFSS